MDGPKLRQNLSLARDDRGQLILHDPFRIGDPIAISLSELEVAKRLTGQHSLAELTILGLSIPALEAFISRLDSARLLDGPNYQQYLAQPIRPPSCIGCYPDDPVGIREQVRTLFSASGLPAPSPQPIKAVLVPHMDYARGNITYGFGFKELLSRSTASTFVILATSHYSAARFSLTRMHFASPLGVVETDQTYVDRIVKHFGSEAELFADPVAHFPEHSIELEVVILQAMRDRPFKIVPVLCGSYHDAIANGQWPQELDDVARMISALRKAEAENDEDVCYIVSGDLAHIGPKFGDDSTPGLISEASPDPVFTARVTRSRIQDDELLQHLKRADAEGYYRAIAAEGDARRICGLPPTYLALNVIRPESGHVSHYQQFIHPQGFESVSFASMAWE